MQYTFHVDWNSTEVEVEANSYDEAVSKADKAVRLNVVRYFDYDFELNEKEVFDD